MKYFLILLSFCFLSSCKSWNCGCPMSYQDMEMPAKGTNSPSQASDFFYEVYDSSMVIYDSRVVISNF